MFKKVFVILVLSLSVGFSAVNFPYPQEKSYGNGTINATSANASANLKTKFTSFLGEFYEESGNLARIKHDTKDNTVSEGIGYGMIMMVYFSDNTTSYQNHFDKLWAYYQKWPNLNGLMHWKIQGFSRVLEQNAATDAELDVAIALAMAHYQFGSTSSKNYLDTAKSLISKIRAQEVSTNNLLKPGDMWDSERNPSYVSPGALEIFKEVESSQATKWQSVIDANYTMLKANQNSSSGLFSDWCRNDGSHSRGSYGYDAARTPWRMAWANAWYGHADAKLLLTNLYTRFLQSKNASSIGGSISLTGTMGGDKNSTFLGPLTNALSYSSENQSKMNDYWTTLMSFKNEWYYSAALQVLTGLLASGNMPNLKALSEAVVPSSSSVAAISSSSSTPASSSSAPSSSSVGLSSSSSPAASSSSVGLSSSSLGPSPESSSSSSLSIAPIVLPKAVFSNGLSAMRNAVNLQAAGNVTVQIFDLKGNAVRTFGFTQGSYVVHIADLSRGIYLVKASGGSWKQTITVPVR
jgi:endo-1,4-beta-D-glucanase Y